MKLRTEILGGGGHTLIWPKRVFAAQQCVVFRVLHLKQGIQFHCFSVLNKVSF